MTPAEMTAMLKIMQSLASTLNGVGLPGLVAIILLWPDVRSWPFYVHESPSNYACGKVSRCFF